MCGLSGVVFRLFDDWMKLIAVAMKPGSHGIGRNIAEKSSRQYMFHQGLLGSQCCSVIKTNFINFMNYFHLSVR